MEKACARCLLVLLFLVLFSLQVSAGSRDVQIVFTKMPEIGCLKISTSGIMGSVGILNECDSPARIRSVYSCFDMIYHEYNGSKAPPVEEYLNSDYTILPKGWDINILQRPGKNYVVIMMEPPQNSGYGYYDGKCNYALLSDHQFRIEGDVAGTEFSVGGICYSVFEVLAYATLAFAIIYFSVLIYARPQKT